MVNWKTASYAVLLVLFPIAWFCPLVETGIFGEVKIPRILGGFTLFKDEQISVVSGLQILWKSDIALAIAVTFFALFAPIVKVAGALLIELDMLSARLKPAIIGLGRLAMADIFLMALLIIIVKGLDVGHVKVAWGIYLFSFCVIASLVLQIINRKKTE